MVPNVSVPRHPTHQRSCIALLPTRGSFGAVWESDDRIDLATAVIAVVVVRKAVVAEIPKVRRRAVDEVALRGQHPLLVVTTDLRVDGSGAYTENLDGEDDDDGDEGDEQDVLDKIGAGLILALSSNRHAGHGEALPPQSCVLTIASVLPQGEEPKY